MGKTLQQSFLGFGLAVLPEMVYTHLKLTSLLFSVHVVHHHQLSIHCSLRAIGTFSLLCYCGPEGDMSLEVTRTLESVLYTRGCQGRAWCLHLLMHRGAQGPLCPLSVSLNLLLVKGAEPGSEGSNYCTLLYAFQNVFQRISRLPQGRDGYQLWKEFVKGSQMSLTYIQCLIDH